MEILVQTLETAAFIYHRNGVFDDVNIGAVPESI